MNPPSGIGLTATVEQASTPGTHQVRLGWLTPAEDADSEAMRLGSLAKLAAL